jgi:hypothetical protein
MVQLSALLWSFCCRCRRRERRPTRLWTSNCAARDSAVARVVQRAFAVEALVKVGVGFGGGSLWLYLV